MGDRFAAEAEGEYLCAEDTVVHRVSHMLHDNILVIMRRHPPNIVTQPDLPVGCATRRERDGQTGEGRTRSFTPSLLKNLPVPFNDVCSRLHSRAINHLVPRHSTDRLFTITIKRVKSGRKGSHDALRRVST